MKGDIHRRKCTMWTCHTCADQKNDCPGISAGHQAKFGQPISGIRRLCRQTLSSPITTSSKQSSWRIRLGDACYRREQDSRCGADGANVEHQYKPPCSTSTQILPGTSTFGSAKMPGMNASQGISLGIEMCTNNIWILGRAIQNKLCWTGGTCYPK